MTPFPGTPIWDYALERGLVSSGMDWNRLDVDYQGREDAIVLSDEMTKEHIDTLFECFRGIRRQQEVRNLLVAGLRRPWKIPGYLWSKAAGVAQ